MFAKEDYLPHYLILSQILSDLPAYSNSQNLSAYLNQVSNMSVQEFFQRTFGIDRIGKTKFGNTKVIDYLKQILSVGDTEEVYFTANTQLLNVVQDAFSNPEALRDVIR